jgi:hypothetical protein
LEAFFNHIAEAGDKGATKYKRRAWKGTVQCRKPHPICSMRIEAQFLAMIGTPNYYYFLPCSSGRKNPD